jgi:hypothetical protein
MNPEDRLALIKSRIDFMYSQILHRPQLFCRPVEVESYVLALESILDCLDDSTPRPDGYRTYLHEKQYGAQRFESRFEVNEDCVLTFARLNSPNASLSPLDDKFIADFQRHWEEFLEWRSRRGVEKP